MRHYVAFLKKELTENTRTYKLLIMLSVFAIFGIMSPLTAKLTPDILNAFMPEEISITIPEPSAFDSYAQFFSNVSQMGLIVTVIVFSGIIGNELSKGTLINMLTKGMSRAAVMLSKYTSMALIWTASYAVSFFITLGYTIYLFPDDKVENLMFSVFNLWLFGMFLLALLLFSAALVNNNYGSMLITGAAVVAMMLCNIHPDAHKYNPLSLSSKSMELITGTSAVSSLYAPVWISIGLLVILTALTVMVFRKKQV